MVEIHGNNIRLLRIVALLWISYLIVLGCADFLFVNLRPGTQSLPLLYYGSLGIIGLMVIGLAFWPWLQTRLEHALLPAAITCMGVLPIAIPMLIIRDMPPGPITVIEGFRSLRFAPLLCLALILVAWHHRWIHVVIFVVGTGLLTIVGLLLQDRYSSTLWISIVITTIQTTALLMIGYGIADLVEKLRHQQTALEEANSMLRHYASTLERLSISRERNRMARELHDTLVHTLSGLTMQLETVKAYWEVDPTSIETMIQSSLETARNGVQETRRALKALRASPLDDLGLRLALCDMAKTAVSTANISLDCQIPDELPLLAPDVEQAIYRIAQEAIANVLHHAQAKHLVMQLAYSDTNIALTVRDDGCGFRGEIPQGHYGIAGMHERAALAGGSVTITSTPKLGTTVHLQIGG